MHPKLIQAHLHMAGTSPARLARELRVSEGAVRHVIYARHASFRIAAAVCRATGRPARELFPGQYPLLDFALGAERTQPLMEAA